MQKTVPWIRLVLALETLMVSCSILFFLAATMFSESVIRHYWQGDDDWLWLTLPAGGVIGLCLGIRFRGTPWMKVVSVAATFGTVLFFIGLSISAFLQPSDLGEAIGKLISQWLLIVALIAAGVCLAVAAVAATIVTVYESTHSK